ncbi:DUF2127 domain-containing protein [Bdellovibrio svalbardensis]|uniref:DUF2127 domain-containing protein n=1 Tax=Bdellovibrio svalbardensis TaxID=2972972 RepID=A0ABT6DLC0_9BACT|nr:DUF2127 domain-containing protein [Bdellovibrio svalbardensis]MDG0817679.1 DUF2127 domain-containing protein [Bdellovibrio svalbardensis]
MTQKSHRKGLHAIAAFEALKGIVVLVIGLELLVFIHGDFQALGEKFLWHFGMNPHSQYPHAVLLFLSGVRDRQVVQGVSLVLAYSLFRFIEAFGLWKERKWAKWLVIISSGLFLPLEFYKMFTHFTWFKLLITIANILVLLYIAYLQLEDKRSRSSVKN